MNGIYLSNGTYYLVETKAPDGYLKLANKVKIEVSESGITAAFDPVSETAINDETANNKMIYTFTVNNTPGQELPNTGGRGTLPYTLGGFILMISALMYGFMMRRRERRLM